MAKVNELSNTIRFTVSEISKLTEVRSQEVFLHGMPWQLKVGKYENGTQNSLSIFLYCVNKEKSSNWTATACAKVKLLPFIDDQQALEYYIPPYIFDHINDGYGTNVLIHWDDLFDANKKYVKDDTIELEVKIKAENPNGLNKSTMKFETIDKSCDCGSHATFQLKVMNISNLMAIRSPEFIMRGMPWKFMIFKNDSHLGILLELTQNSGNVSCQVEMSAKLISSKGNVDPIEKSITKKVQWLGSSFMENIISWVEMLKPGKGFIKDDSIALTIEIKTDKPEGVVPTDASKRRRFECSICLKGIGDQDLSTTPCGHLFCTTCIKTAVRKRGVCPLCQRAVQLNDLKPMYLSAEK